MPAAETISGPVLFTLADVERKFTAETLRRGRAYARDGSVTKLEVRADGRLLLAKVQGSARRPYSVTVSIDGHRPGRIQASCTCPVSFACKHCAAAMLAALGQGRGAKLPPPPPQDPLAGPVRFWLETLSTVAAPPPERGPAPERVLYILDSVATAGGGHTAALQVIVARPLKAGGMGAGRPYDVHNLTHGAAKFLTLEDVLVGQLLTGRNYSHGRVLPDDPAQLDLAFRRMVATGRCHYRDKDAPPLEQGPERPGRLAWTLGPMGEQRPTVEAEDPALTVLPCAAPWYVDPAANLAGPLAFAEPPRLVAAFLDAPPVAPGQGEAVRRYLASRLPGHTLPPPRQEITVATITDPPVPSLRLTSERVSPLYGSGSGYGSAAETVFDLALLGFDYGGTLLSGDKEPAEIRYAEGDRILVRRRDRKAERAARRRLEGLGFVPAGILPRGSDRRQRTGFALPADEAAWRRFVHREVPALEAEGWRIETEAGFRHRVVEAEGDWEASLGERSGWWFSLELGVEVDGERVPLLPVLAQAVRRMRASRDGGDLLQGDTLYAPLPDGRTLALPTERVRPMLETLVELYDPDSSPTGASLEISLAQAAALAEIAAATRLRWLAGSRLLELIERLRQAGTVEEADAPEGLQAELRPYQRRGLGWLRFLRENDLGGILADDMGLGKTIQTLAHLLAEKRAGRLDAPALVVCPTSVVPNWEAEAARFARDLRVLRLHGPSRAAAFAGIGEADLVLSTYALLPRDADALLPVEWSLVALDEAQAIKNPASKAAQTACRLEARHRLCLTGTPVENHLGELFSQFAFLMPGLLGEQRRFARLFRTPIEKRGNAERRRALAARLRPFILRRTKEQVAPELPPKTEILRRVALAGDQRDLYETVRLAMHERVRQEIAARGFERSRIIVLDALLKLRQVCCDPRLVKLKAARRAAGSGKLDQLLDMLPQLLEDGRRILLFSQFTSMLDLIRPELDAAGIPYVELRGDTVDRETPVARFQAGEVPLFLVSLKAGGFGLNLTAADTVILYDPWWNPAVEAQATDRAHRIGQDKPVFVYKLIAEGTIEERMLELQARKRALADQLLDDAEGGFTGFDQSDLDRLLAPLG